MTARLGNVASTTRVAWRLARHEPVAYALTWFGWVTFFTTPLLTGLLVKVVLDRVADAPAGGLTVPWGLLAVLVGIEVVRWTWLILIAVQWHGCWVGWQTVPRVNLLRSLVAAPGPAAGRLPGSPGEAVSRFRDDVEDLAMVLDVWLDLSGAVVSSTIAVAVLIAIDPLAAVAVVVPIVIAASATTWLGPRLRRWRRAAREATAGVTGFIGDTFGGVLAVQAGNAGPAIEDRFAHLNAERAQVSRRDQVGSELVRSLGYGTGEVAVGVVLVAVAGAFRGGDLSVGDLGLFAAYATVIAELPKWVGRYLVYQRQADVSIDRLAELLPVPDRRAVVSPTRTHLRHGPHRSPPRTARSTPARSARARSRNWWSRASRSATRSPDGASAASTSWSDTASWWSSPAPWDRASRRCSGPCSAWWAPIPGPSAGTAGPWTTRPRCWCRPVPPTCRRSPACSASRWAARSCSVPRARGSSARCG
jgi:ATP-binding cassette subfamily B protein